MNRLILIISIICYPILLNAQEFDSIVDTRDGQVYKTVKIGDQWWMAKNLNTRVFPDGVPIPFIRDYTEWSGINYYDKVCRYYEYDSILGDTYGALYTWGAAVNGSLSSDENPSGIQGVCPTGWHLPSDSEWKGLEKYLGMSEEDAERTGYRGTNEGGKLKEAGMNHWFYPNEGATDERGFQALPGGYCTSFGDCYGKSYHTLFWSSTENNKQNMNAWMRHLYCDSSNIDRNYNSKHGFYSVRCIKNSHISNINDGNLKLDGLICFPNPANNVITIKFNSITWYTIEITSLNGQLIFSTIFDGPTLQIDLSSFQKGVYFITVRSRDTVRTEKIIKL